MKRILYIPFDQLNENYGVLKDSDPESDVIAMVESRRMTSGRNWHGQRLHFLISSARHFVAELREHGYSVRYEKTGTTVSGLDRIRAEFPGLPIVAAEPSSHRQYQILKEYGVEFVETDFFLTPRNIFTAWADGQKSYLMENFYRAQRIRLNILVEGNKPVGGAWNFDKENRLPLPKAYQWPTYIEHDLDEIDHQVGKEINYLPSGTWATNRAGAESQLQNFIENHFPHFGPYEDAMAEDNWAMHHSLLSPYLNNGLLHPLQVINAALTAFETGGVPIASAEGFIRQVIGWREYVNGMYWYLGENFRENNQLGAMRNLLPLFTDASKTQMNCVRSIVADIDKRAWVHHIPRLMVLRNLALITGTNPQQFLDWMREVFIDATDWVMVPNVIGMGLHADGGVMMSKPYAAGGAYISRMSSYCKGCNYNPKLRVGESACPFTTLYWDFLDRHKDSFIKNHRMSQQITGLKRLSDLDQLRLRAAQVLDGLETGLI
jgi:deoxyribodipyrimidine photolyase-related protein